MAHSMIADDMVIFAKVVEMNGFTAAARVLAVPKVRISRSVAQLERELGVRLLERTTRRIALTAPGRSILAHCQRVALEAEAARAALLPVASGASLRVCVDQAYGRLLVAPLVPRFLERFPQVALRLVTAGDDGEAGSYDVELRSDGRLAEGEVASSLGTPPMILCAAPGYLAGKALPQTPSDLGAHALLWSTTETNPQLRLSKDGGKILGRSIRDVNTVNGVRVTLEDGAWVLVRASSNKPELVVVVESMTSDDDMKRLFREEVKPRLAKFPEVGAYNQEI